MQSEYGRVSKDDQEARDLWHERLGMLVIFAHFLWESPQQWTCGASMTPLEITIAIHYWTSPVPYKGGSENWTELDSKIVQSMIDGHLLEYQGSNLSGNTPAMRCFIQALCDVPWPSIRWVCEKSPVSAGGDSGG